MTQSKSQSKLLAKDTEGIFLIDKPSGISSHGVVNRVRNITGIKRVGHSGTLDPLASGLLIVLVGKAYTKLQDSFLKKPKTYTCTAQLGITTDTYDITGQITNKVEWEQLKYIDSSQMLTALKDFKGKITQTVPAFSAVKISGQKLYDKAIKKTLKLEDLPTREVEIFDLVLTQLKKDVMTKKVYFSIETTVSSGTYIRSLIHDLGQKLRVGATVTELRRTKIDQYSVTDAIQVFDPETFSFGEKFSAASARS